MTEESEREWFASKLTDILAEMHHDGKGDENGFWGAAGRFSTFLFRATYDWFRHERKLPDETKTQRLMNLLISSTGLLSQAEEHEPKAISIHLIYENNLVESVTTPLTEEHTKALMKAHYMLFMEMKKQLEEE